MVTMQLENAGLLAARVRELELQAQLEKERTERRMETMQLENRLREQASQGRTSLSRQSAKNYRKDFSAVSFC